MSVQLDSILEQLNLSRDIFDMLLLIGLCLIFVFVVSCIIDVSITRKRASKYATLFKENFDKGKNIKETMEETVKVYKPKSEEAKALQAGLHYLQHSISKDYQTALQNIEMIFDRNEEVLDVHKYCIEESQKSRFLMLEDLSKK